MLDDDKNINSETPLSGDELDITQEQTVESSIDDVEIDNVVEETFDMLPIKPKEDDEENEETSEDKIENSEDTENSNDADDDVNPEFQSNSDFDVSNDEVNDIFSNISAIANENLQPDAEDITEIDEDDTVTVQPVKFAAFDDSKEILGDASKNLDNLMDIKLQLTVELGRATLPVKKVLELTRGSIIELEKIAGEPVELFANGKLIAHGEVVVIEDNFGLRITSMTEPENRLNGLQ